MRKLSTVSWSSSYWKNFPSSQLIWLGVWALTCFVKLSPAPPVYTRVQSSSEGFSIMDLMGECPKISWWARGIIGSRPDIRYLGLKAGCTSCCCWGGGVCWRWWGEFGRWEQESEPVGGGREGVASGSWEPLFSSILDVKWDNVNSLGIWKVVFKWHFLL